MLTARLALGTALGLAAAGLSLVVGARLGRRDVTGPGRRAARAFSVWWLALGVDTTINSLTWLAAALGLATGPVTAALTYAALAAVCVMLWGLVEYLVYLLTGRAGAFAPVAAFYGLSFLGAVALIASLRPVGVTLGRWGGAIAYARQPSPGVALGFALFFLLPPILGALAYGSLCLGAERRTQRFRIGVVAASIFVWFASGLALPGDSDAVALLRYAIAVLAILAIYSTYAPPAWLKRALRVEGLADEAARDPMPEAADAEAARMAGAAARARRREGLDARLRDLV